MPQALLAADNPIVAWAMSAGGSGSDYGEAVAALADGSSIITGSVSGTTTFGATTISTTGSDDVIVAKLRAVGTWAWATSASGPSSKWGWGISALPDGSAIVTGVLRGNATFGATTLQSTTGSGDVFVAKITAGGVWEWASKAGGLNLDEGQSISTLADGSAIVTGRFRDSATFGDITITSAPGSIVGTDDLFVAKIDANGSWTWATPAGGTSDNDHVESNPTFFGDITLSNGGVSASPDIFVAKITSDGRWASARSAGSVGSDYATGTSALPDGSSVVTGWVQISSNFGGIPLTVPSGTAMVVFTAKIGAAGTWEWVRPGGKTGYATQMGSGVVASPDGSTVTTGRFGGGLTFGSFPLTSAGAADVFTVRYVDAPEAPAAPVATAGDGSAAVSLTPLAGGSVMSYLVTSSPGTKTCTVSAPATACTVGGLANGTSYTSVATATNPAGTGPASIPSNAVMPTAAARPGTKPSLTGIVPATATRITQRATAQRGRASAKARCNIRRTTARRTYTCTVRLAKGRWTLATTAYTGTTRLASFATRVQVSPRIPVTG